MQLNFELKKIKEEMLKRAYIGRDLWIELKEEYDLGIEDCLLLMYKKNKNINDSVLNNLNRYIKKKYIRQMIIVADFQGLIADQDNIKWVVKKNRDVADFECYYRCVQFTNNIIIVSLEEPYGTGKIIGKEGITLDDYVRDAILV